MFRAGWRGGGGGGTEGENEGGRGSTSKRLSQNRQMQCLEWCNGTEARISSKKCKVIIPLTHATFILIVPMKVTSHELS